MQKTSDISLKEALRRRAQEERARHRVRDGFSRAWQDGVLALHRRMVHDSPPARFGLPGLDHAIGGFLPRGGFVEIYGPPSTGKTELALMMARDVTRSGAGVVWIDAEKAMPETRARRLGLARESMVILRGYDGEDAIDAACLLLRSGRFGAIVIDSVAALLPRAEVQAPIGDATRFAHHGLVAGLVRRLPKECAHATILAVNQLRLRPVGTDAAMRVTPGARDLARTALLRIETKSLGVVRSGGQVIGEDFGFLVAKNVSGAPFQRWRSTYLFEHGFDIVKDTLQLGEKVGVVRYGDASSMPGTTFASRRDAYRLLSKDESALSILKMKIEHAASRQTMMKIEDNKD